jgi:hypothetical protein
MATCGYLARLWPDSVEWPAHSALPGGPRPSTVFWGRATDNNAGPAFRGQAPSSSPRNQGAPRATAHDRVAKGTSMLDPGSPLAAAAAFGPEQNLVQKTGAGQTMPILVTDRYPSTSMRSTWICEPL